MTPVYLVGADGSNCGSRALDYATERAKSNDGKVIVAHVIEWSPYTFSTAAENEQRHKRREEELERARETIIEPIVRCLEEKGVKAEGIVRHGHAAETLARLATELDVTCIVIGRKGSSRLKAQIFGSVASNLVQVADRPVTVVP